MPKLHFTDVSIRALKPHDATTTYWDAALPAFGVRVGKKAKTFLVIQGGGRRIKIGRYPKTTLSEARSQAHRIIGGAGSVQRSSRSSRVVLKASDAVTRFLETHAAATRSRTRYEYERLLKRHFLPKHGSCPFSTISTADILTITDGLSETPAEALHVHAALKTLFGWAVSRQLLTASPCVGLKPPSKPVSRSHTLTDEEFASAFIVAGTLPGSFGKIIQLCILTGQRRSEIGTLRAEYISGDLLTLPAALTKNKHEHIVPLNRAALNIIATLPAKGYLFPGRAINGPFNAWSKCKAAFDKLCPIEEWVIHDLRRTFATVHAQLGTPPHIVERMLNHVSGQISGVAAIYNRYAYLPEMRDALARYQAHLEKLCSRM